MNKITVYLNISLLRDYSFEKSAGQCSEVDLRMRNDAHSFEIRTRTKVKFGYFGYSEKPVFCNGQIVMHPEVPSSPFSFDTSVYPFNLQPGCDPMLTLSWNNEQVNDALAFNAKFLFVRMAHIENPWAIRPSLFGSNNYFNQADIDCGAFLGLHFGITGGWDAITAPDNGAWARVPIIMPADDNAHLVLVYNIDGVLSYMLELIPISNKYAVLPLAYYQNRFYHSPLRLYIPPKPPYTLLNTHLLADHPDAEVVLTDDIILALVNKPSSEMVYLANPGGDAWIDHLDLAPLVGRKVICTVFTSKNHEEKKKYYQTAVKMAEKLHAVGITPSFAILNLDRGVN